MKKIIILISIILSSGIIFSQKNEIRTLKKWQLNGYGKSAERIGDTYSAIDYYSELYNRNSKNSYLNFKLASLYFDIKNYDAAKGLFYDIYMSKDKKYYKSAFYYAKILKTEEKYDSAIMYFEKYKELVTNIEKGLDLNYSYFLISQEIEGCEYADNSLKDKNMIQVVHLDKTINRAHMESAPIVWNDTTLVYSSMMVDTIPEILIDNRNNEPTNQFYMAKLIDNKWQGGYIAPKPFFNFDSLHSSNGVFTDDKSRFYFTLSKENWEGKIISSIYVSKYEKGKWRDPEMLDERINLKNFTSTQPAIGKCYNPDYDVIYFISDRPGGIGGLDIWYSIYDKVNKIYKKPFNAGSFINTPGNEITPFFDVHTKSLYFSSDGLPGLGGYDIYKTIGELVNWIPSENIGRPINSGYDDIYYSHTKEREQGYIVSNRSESIILKSPHCCYDIFEYKIYEDNLSEITGIIYETNSSIQDELSEKKNIDSLAKQYVSSNTLIELHIENENNGELIFINSDTTDMEGKFSFDVEDRKKYQLSIYKDGYTPTKVMFNTSSKDKILVMDSVTIVPIEKNPLKLENIYFEYNQWDLNESSKLFIDTTLIAAMKKYKDIVIEISAHTDKTGSIEYNLELSKNRAESVENYIISKGIDPSRVIAIGYGESKPIINDQIVNRKVNTETNDKNRRIEFRVIGLIIKDN